MRSQASVVSLSWIPSEAVRGMQRTAFERGVAHYDEPPPDVLTDLDALQAADRFRFANRLAAWAEFDDATGRPTSFGYAPNSKGLLGSTIVFKGRRLSWNFQAFAMPDLQREPEVSDDSVRFVQTAGGRTGIPAPRRVRRRPFFQWQAPLAWSTLALTLSAQTAPVIEVVGASRFPRHWVYGPDGALALKSGMTDFTDWYRRAFGKGTPWGDEDSPAVIAAVETALERELSTGIMRSGTRPVMRTEPAGTVLVREGDEGSSLLFVVDGIVRAELGGERLAEYGPGALLGERASLEGGRRTSTLVAVTAVRLAIVPADTIEHDLLAQLREGHRHEEEQ